MIFKDIRSGNKKVDDYIESLEAYYEKDKSSNIKKLISACDDIAGVIADDVILLKQEGNDDEIDSRLQMLGSKKNKIYERFMMLINQMKNFKTLSDLSDEIKDKSSPKEQKSPVEDEIEQLKQPKRKTNIQDFIIEQ